MISTIIWKLSDLCCYHHFFCYNNDTTYFQPVIESLCDIQKIICECCGIFEYKHDSIIIQLPKFFPPSIRQNMN